MDLNKRQFSLVDAEAYQRPPSGEWGRDLDLSTGGTTPHYRNVQGMCPSCPEVIVNNPVTGMPMHESTAIGVDWSFAQALTGRPWGKESRRDPQ